MIKVGDKVKIIDLNKIGEVIEVITFSEIADEFDVTPCYRIKVPNTSVTFGRSAEEVEKI